jgi:hypothetical protein
VSRQEAEDSMLAYAMRVLIQRTAWHAVVTEKEAEQDPDLFLAGYAAAREDAWQDLLKVLDAAERKFPNVDRRL